MALVLRLPLLRSSKKSMSLPASAGWAAAAWGTYPPWPIFPGSVSRTRRSEYALPISPPPSPLLSMPPPRKNSSTFAVMWLKRKTNAQMETLAASGAGRCDGKGTCRQGRQYRSGPDDEHGPRRARRPQLGRVRRRSVFGGRRCIRDDTGSAVRRRTSVRQALYQQVSAALVQSVRAVVAELPD